MLKKISDNELMTIVGGGAVGWWFSAGYNAAKSLWKHRRSYGKGYFDSPFH